MSGRQDDDGEQPPEDRGDHRRRRTRSAKPEDVRQRVQAHDDGSGHVGHAASEEPLAQKEKNDARNGTDVAQDVVNRMRSGIGVFVYR